MPETFLLHSRRRSPVGAASGETLALLAAIAVAGAGGLSAYGLAMDAAIAGGAAGGAGGLRLGAVSVEAAELDRDSVIEALGDKGLSAEDIEEIEALGIELEHLMDYSREDLEAFGVDAGKVDAILGIDPATIAPAPPGQGGGEDHTDGNPPEPQLDPTELPDLGEVDPNELLEGTGEEFMIDELDPNSARFAECQGLTDAQARYNCLANSAGIEPPPSYDMGGEGCFGAEFGTCVKDGWHKFSNAFGDTVSGIFNFFKSAVTEPGDFFGGIAYAISHPIDTVKSVWNYYKGRCSEDAYTCAGTITGDLAFSLGAGIFGRLAHAGKVAAVRRFPTLAGIPGFRTAGSRVAFGPFKQDEFAKGGRAIKGGFDWDHWDEALEGLWETKKVVPRTGFGPLNRFRTAERLLGEEANVARVMADQIRRGRPSLTTLHFDDALKSGSLKKGTVYPMGKGGEAFGQVLDEWVAARPVTAADRALLRVADNGNGTLSLSDKLLGFKVDDGGITLIFKDSDDIARGLSSYGGKGMTYRPTKFRTGGEMQDGFLVEIAQSRVPGSGSWEMAPWKDALMFGVPVAGTGEVLRHNTGREPALATP